MNKKSREIKPGEHITTFPICGLLKKRVESEDFSEVVIEVRDGYTFTIPAKYIKRKATSKDMDTTNYF